MPLMMYYGHLDKCRIQTERDREKVSIIIVNSEKGADERSGEREGIK